MAAKKGGKKAAKKGGAKKGGAKKAAAKKARQRRRRRSARRTRRSWRRSSQMRRSLRSSVAIRFRAPRSRRSSGQYIKKNGLQDAKERRMINADDKLKPVFGGKGKVSMFEMTKLVNKHIK